MHEEKGGGPRAQPAHAAPLHSTISPRCEAEVTSASRSAHKNQTTRCSAPAGAQRSRDAVEIGPRLQALRLRDPIRDGDEEHRLTPSGHRQPSEAVYAGEGSRLGSDVPAAGFGVVLEAVAQGAGEAGDR